MVQETKAHIAPTTQSFFLRFAWLCLLKLLCEFQHLSKKGGIVHSHILLDSYCRHLRIPFYLFPVIFLEDASVMMQLEAVFTAGALGAALRTLSVLCVS